MRLLRLFQLILTAACCFAQNPVKLAGSARIDILAGSGVGSITNGAIVKGSGSLGRMTWLSTAEQPRSYTCDFRIIHFGWTEFTIQFTPQNSGIVELAILGPWEQSPNSGPIYRQEVLWDNLSATNVTLANGSFETVTGGIPSGWFRPWGDGAVDTSSIALDGARYARSWHDGRWAKNLSVTAGRTVTLRFFARAFIPASFVDNPRIAGTNTPAHLARLKFMRGANLGNYLEAPPGENWGQTYSATDFTQIKAEGFDHVRIPARWNAYTGPAPNYALSETFAQKVDTLVNGAIAKGLGALVNIHHFDEFTTDPAGQSNKFYKIWEQIAARYASKTNLVAFELLNEPKDAATTTVLNPINAEAIRRIRLTNPDRTIFVGPGQFNSIGELTALRLPANDTNLIVTVHSYEPFLFTHQGASWTGPDTTTTGVLYPGPPPTPKTPASSTQSVVDWFNRYNTSPTDQNPSSKAAFIGSLELAKTWSDYYGRPVHIGEFGAYEMADAVSRANFYRDMRETADRLGLAWAIWDWKAGFKYWDASKNAPAPGMPDALFPKPVLKSKPRGQIETDAAVGKRLRVLRSETLPAPATAWEVVNDSSLLSPTLNFVDPAQPPTQAFYQIEWVK